MPDTRSITPLDPKGLPCYSLTDLARVAQDRLGDRTYQDVANELDISRPAVSRALQRPQARDFKTLARVLDLVGIRISKSVRYPVHEDEAGEYGPE
jgi:hypothetical protein